MAFENVAIRNPVSLGELILGASADFAFQLAKRFSHRAFSLCDQAPVSFPKSVDSHQRLALLSAPVGLVFADIWN
jgi:hypothetical protein